MTTTTTADESISRPALDDETLAALVARSSTIMERLSGSFEPVAPDNSNVIERRLQAWIESVAPGDRDQFRRRLQWDGYDEAGVTRVLGPVCLRPDAALPAWTDILRAVVGIAPSIGEIPVVDRAVRENMPMPFEEVALPFLLVARQRLADLAGQNYRLLSDVAAVTLERSLLSSLTQTAAEALYLEFSITRARTQSSFARLFAFVDGGRSEYDAFVLSLLEKGLLPLFQTYPVLARVLATTTSFWIEANTEFLSRLAADLGDLQDVFGGGEDLGGVTALQPSLSDPHHGQRTVVAVTFASGVRVVYKPKDLGTELAYIRLLGWLNDQGAPYPFHLLKVLDRTTHGWVEFVTAMPVEDEEQAGRYYRRAGALLSLLFALEVTDCHRENIIAHGEHPILVDMETVMHHRGFVEDQDEEARQYGMAMDRLQNSVLRIGLLPLWNVHKDQHIAYDVSGLGGATQQNVPFQRRDWQHINTDAMTMDFVQSVMDVGPNVAMLGDKPLALQDYALELEEGFETMYRFLMEQREALLAEGSPLHDLAAHLVRFVFRATRVYALIQRGALDPRYLRDGADWAIQFEMLSRAAMPLLTESRLSGRPSIFWPVFKAERQAMEQGDIPFFTGRPNSDSMEVDGIVVAGTFEEPSFARAVRRIEAMGEEDLEWQMTFIRGTVYSLVARSAAVSISGGPVEPATSQPLSRDELVAEAVSIAEGVRDHALQAGDGASWIVPHFLVQAERYQLAPAAADLYDGATGMALFLAAVDRLTGKSYGDLARAALRPLRHDLERMGELTGRYMPIGSAAGIASVAYTLLNVGQLLDDPALIEDAVSFARLITPQKIEEDETLDVIAGSSGAILGLLAVYRATGQQDLLELAAAAGRHLLAARVASAGGLRAWPTLSGIMMTGFSHGAAGIAYALLQLYAATGEPEFLEGGREGIAYEDSLFVPEEGNWPDLRPDSEGGFMSGWCHGAPGIGLGRAAGLSMLDTPEIRRDIDAAIDTTLKLHSNGVENLCCGIFGRCEVLQTVGGMLDRPELVTEAQVNASAVVRRARDRGFIIHNLMPAGLYAPGFFQGTSGIGYTLLRLAYPDQLPNVLLWQ